MIFLAHYVCRSCKGKKLVEKQGIVNAGNPSEAVAKVCKIVDWPYRYEDCKLEFKEGETLCEKKDENGKNYLIQVSYLDRMMTLKEKE